MQIKTHVEGFIGTIIIDYPEKRNALSNQLVELLSQANDRFGSLADIRTSPRHVRFTPNNGRWAAHPSQHLAVGSRLGGHLTVEFFLLRCDCLEMGPFASKVS